MVALTAWLADRPPTTNCSDGSWLNSNKHVILASKVVVHPWYGPHHVYGYFVIPAHYSDTGYSATVTVRGVKDPAALSEGSVNFHGDIVPTELGHYVKHAHVRTRVALWFLMTGHFGDLRATCNWALVFTKKKS
jgi:hypothetical protein